MRHKLRTIAGSVLISLTSATGGYFAGHAEKTRPQAKLAEAANTLPHPPDRFSFSPGKKLRETDLQCGELDDLLLRYSRMTSEQMEREMDRWIEYGKEQNKFNDLSDNQRIALSFLCYNWGRISPKQALKKTENRGDLSQIAAPLIIQGWAEKHPEAAAAYFAEHKKDLPQSRNALRNIAEEMGRTSPDHALKWADRLTSEERKEALPSLFNRLDASSPEQLQRYIGRLTPEDLKNDLLLSTVAHRLAASDWDAARQWTDTLNGDQKKSALKSVFNRLARQDPDKAIAEFNTLDGDTKSSVAKTITYGMAIQNPVQALQWQESLGSGEINASTALCVTIYGRCMPEFQNYVTQMKDGPTKDTLLSSLVSTNSDGFVNFDKTLALADGIKNPGKKEQCVQNVLHNWAFQQPKKAKTWIEASSLPEDIKKKQLNFCEQMERYHTLPDNN